jgi:DNA-binding CsgD family transcriptional regulator
MTFTVTPDIETRLDNLKRRVFYNQTKSEMLRMLINAGIESMAERGDGRDDQQVGRQGGGRDDQRGSRRGGGRDDQRGSWQSDQWGARESNASPDEAMPLKREDVAADCGAWERLFERYGLTRREREIAALLLSGEAVKSIARTLGVSHSAINFHSTNLYRKLEVQSRVQLIERFRWGNTDHSA